MKFGTVAGPDQVATMARALDAYWKQGGIMSQTERENIAAKSVALYDLGIAGEDEILAALTMPAAADHRQIKSHQQHDHQGS